MSAAVLLSFIHGEWIITPHDFSAPALTVNDLAAVRGDGIFETLLLHYGQIIKPQRHLARLRASAQLLDLSLPPDSVLWEALTVMTHTFVTHNPAHKEASVRICVSRGIESSPKVHVFMMVSELSPTIYDIRTQGVAVLALNRGYDTQYARSAPWSLLGAKTLSYAPNMAATRYAQSRGADEALYVSSDGYVLEGTKGAIVWKKGKTLYSPPHDSGILPSTTQQELFAGAAQQGYNTEYALVSPAQLQDTDGVWLISSLTLAASVHTIDNQPIATPNVDTSQWLWHTLGKQLPLIHYPYEK